MLSHNDMQRQNSPTTHMSRLIYILYYYKCQWTPSTSLIQIVHSSMGYVESGRCASRVVCELILATRLLDCAINVSTLLLLLKINYLLTYVTSRAAPLYLGFRLSDNAAIVAPRSIAAFYSALRTPRR